MANPISKLSLVINGVTTQLDVHDANAVDLTSNQTVGGIKTFSNAPVVNSISLDGKTIDTDANGNMTFDSHIVDTIEEQGNGYIRYSNGLQICYGVAKNNNGISTGVTRHSFPMAFIAIPNIAVAPKARAESGAYAVTLIVENGTTFIINSWSMYTNSPELTSAPLVSDYVAIGKWK